MLKVGGFSEQLNYLLVREPCISMYPGTSMVFHSFLLGANPGRVVRPAAKPVGSVDQVFPLTNHVPRVAKAHCLNQVLFTSVFLSSDAHLPVCPYANTVPLCQVQNQCAHSMDGVITPASGIP